jgi:hypothetical protein
VPPFYYGETHRDLNEAVAYELERAAVGMAGTTEMAIVRGDQV